MSIKSKDQIENLKEALASKLSPLGHKVQAIVNYDNFFIMPDLVDEFAQLARYLIDNFYASVTRYTTNAFMRMKLGDALEAKKVPVNLFETKEQAARLLTTE
jgi:propionate CoA-transferase